MQNGRQGGGGGIDPTTDAAVLARIDVKYASSAGEQVKAPYCPSAPPSQHDATIDRSQQR